ncbi:MAG: hypothetical protein KKF44_03530 [Nanoarchaeota archaeon]|nr:hypothetical protein [Nanoarchaeota archaeon]
MKRPIQSASGYHPGKKGVFFSLVSVFIVTVFYLSLQLSTKYEMQETEMETTRARVETLNSIIIDLDDRYFDRMIYASGKSALGAMSMYAANAAGAADGHCSVAYFSCSGLDVISEFNQYREFDKEFNLTMSIGFLLNPDRNGNDIDLRTIPQINSRFNLNKNTLSAMTYELEQRFMDIQLDIRDLDIIITDVRQVSPFMVKIGADITYYFKDGMGIASWKGDTHKEVLVNIEGMYDPRNDGLPIWRDEYILDSAGPFGYTEHSFINKLKMRKFPVDPLTFEDSGLGICPTALSAISCD